MLRSGQEAGRRKRVLRGAAIGLTGIVLLGTAACSGGDDDSKGDEKDKKPTIEAAPKGVVQVVMPGDVEATLKPLAGAVGTETTRIALVGTAEVDTIGRGKATRRPADGEKFLVADLTASNIKVSDLVDRVAQGEMAKRGKVSFGVKVGTATGAPTAVNFETPTYSPLPIDLDDPPKAPAVDPNAPLTRRLIVSAPEDADTIDLVVLSEGLEQRLSLLTGKPGSKNIAVLARANRELVGDAPAQDISFTATEFGMSASGNEKVKVAGASLQLAGGTGDERKAGPGRAFLHVAFDLSGLNFSKATELSLADGTVIQPLAPEADDDILSGTIPIVVFDVPADFIAGTIVLGKDYSWEVPTGGTMSARFDAKVEYAIAIPLEAPAAPA